MNYLLVITFQKLLLLLPHGARVAIFKALASIVYLLLQNKNKVIEQNLRYVYKNPSKDFIKQIQKDCYYYGGRNILSLLESPSYNKEVIQKQLHFQNKERVLALLEQNKPIVFITAHYGNVDLLGYIMGNFVTKNFVQVQRKLDNDPKLTEHMTKLRQGYGYEIVERKGALRHLVKALKKGDSVSLIVDQHVNPKVGSKIEFLGKEAYQSNAPAYLARKFDAPIMPVFLEYTHKDSFTVSFEEPFYVEKSDNEDADILRATQKQADIISKQIYKNPNQWFWCHKRFKTGEKIYD
ncbi:MAG: lysophospholipid acyltransferase family protein [Campylobacterota bacterium]